MRDMRYKKRRSRSFSLSRYLENCDATVPQEDVELE
jgi:hypothetical protein